MFGLGLLLGALEDELGRRLGVGVVEDVAGGWVGRRHLGTGRQGGGLAGLLRQGEQFRRQGGVHSIGRRLLGHRQLVRRMGGLLGVRGRH